VTPGQWRGCAGYGGAIFALHIGGAAALVAAARAHPALLGMGFLAYTLGTRTHVCSASGLSV
jgi:high-affinity nickel permease